jgi:hypothetical protein
MKAALAALVLLCVTPAAGQVHRLETPYLDCVLSGASRAACRRFLKTPQQAYIAAMKRYGFTAAEARRMSSSGGTVKLKCRPDRSGGFDCEHP